MLNLPGSVRNAFGIVVCPDCNRAVQHGRLVHDATCPLAHCWDAIRDDDRDWFARTGRSHRRRPPTWCEVAEHRLLDGREPIAVIVERIAPGIHAKRFEVSP